MYEKTIQKIEEQLAKIDNRIVKADEYVEQGVNVEGSAYLHLDDWRGDSGHPLWMKNHMIPATMKARAKKERALEAIENKAKEKKLRARRKQPSP